MRDKELIIRHNPETGLWEEYKEPYMTIECPTEEDYLRLEKILDYWKNRPQWISVKDRLPEGDVRVLVILNSKRSDTEMDTDRMHAGEWVRWGNDVTHWMPLPEPPEDYNHG